MGLGRWPLFARATALGLLLANLGGCETVPGEEQDVATRQPHYDLPPRLAVGEAMVPFRTPGYRIGMGDELVVSVVGHQEFSGSHKVDSNGQIHVQYLGSPVEVSGLTKIDVGEKLQRLLRPYMTSDIYVDVTIHRATSKAIYIYGAVHVAGRYHLSDTLVTLQDALADQQLFGTAADLANVYVISPDPEKPTHVQVNARDLLLGLSRDNLVLKPGDIVYVPTTFYSKFTTTLRDVLNLTGQGRSTDETVQFLEKRLGSLGSSLSRPK